MTLDIKTVEIVRQGRDDQQGYINGLPEEIEQQTADQKDSVPPTTGHNEVQDKHDGKEDIQETDAGKQQGTRLLGTFENDGL